MLDVNTYQDSSLCFLQPGFCFGKEIKKPYNLTLQQATAVTALVVGRVSPTSI